MRNDRYFGLNDARLRYRDEGTGPAVMLIHGWALDLEMWEPQVGELSRTYRVVRFDRRGFGLSRGRPWLAEDAADTRALCAYLGIRRVALVGMSQGARVLQKLAASAPELVSALVFDGAPDMRRGARLTAGDIPLAALASLARNDGVEAFRQAWQEHPLTRLVTTSRQAHRLLGEVLGRYPGADLLEAGPETQEAAKPAAATPRIQSFQAIRIPALVINGRYDLASRKLAGSILARALPCAERRIIARAGHLPNLDNPADYNRIVRRFLARHAR
jgi:pimeloyl-ACP methyl ester carboxylesterase